MPLVSITRSIQEGMAGTLGFVATVVGLGAIFGQMLESSGGAESLAHYLVNKFGKERAPWAMVMTGFIVAIPVFFDVGFIILVPIVYALSRDTKRSLLYYAIPLLAGLATTHSFIPPTPGPVAVADIINAQLGWVILLGLIIATLIATYFLCIKRGIDKQKILDLSTKALGPAGVVRVTQGSATVAMITAASIIAPVISEFNLNDPQRALVVIAIASGATLLSHVNDSGFWLVGKYLGMNETQTLQSWTVMESIIAFCGLIFTLLASLFF